MTEANRRYDQSEKGLARHRRANTSEKGRARKRRYSRRKGNLMTTLRRREQRLQEMTQ